MDKLIAIIWLIVLTQVEIGLGNRGIIAAIKDNGCASHIEIPSKSEYREYNEGNL